MYNHVFQNTLIKDKIQKETGDKIMFSCTHPGIGNFFIIQKLEGQLHVQFLPVAEMPTSGDFFLLGPPSPPNQCPNQLNLTDAPTHPPPPHNTENSFNDVDQQICSVSRRVGICCWHLHPLFLN